MGPYNTSFLANPYNPVGPQDNTGRVSGYRRFGINPFDMSAFGSDSILGPAFLNDAEGGRFGYERALQSMGGSTPFQNFMRSRQEVNRSRYGAEQANDPSLTWTQWLTRRQGDFANEFSSLGSNGRFPYGGADQRQSRVRWI